MRKLLLIFLLAPLIVTAQPFSKTEISKWQQQAKQVTIIRDNWGIPHIYGTSDADAVFGMLYAQCEDDFKRVEMNYIEKLGRLSELNGGKDLYSDLQIRMLIDTSDAKKDYRQAPVWLKVLLQAFADGINYYLHTHPATKPALLTRFEPWFPLLWTDGSIGAIDVADITLNDLRSFYPVEKELAVVTEKSRLYDQFADGSNGFALAPARTESGNALLYINPHTTYYFRPEIQVNSEEGLHAYGAVTWGQFFIYQGFNEHCGWMHTSSYSDVADTYIEKVSRQEGRLVYLYDGKTKPVIQKEIDIYYLSSGVKQKKHFTVYYTHHGPVMAKRNGNWIAVRANNRDSKGLIQSFTRTKSRSYEEFTTSMQLLANTSNNTVYADDKGNIAYWHGNFMPKRDVSFNWRKPVDGSITATEWKGLHTLDELIQVKNPATGWIQNCNSTPFTVSGSSSPKKENYPAYMAPMGENFRGVNATALLDANKGYTLDKLIATGYNTHLPAFDLLIPALLQCWEQKKEDTAYASLAGPMKILAAWDRNCSTSSVATTLAVEWGEKIWRSIQRTNGEDDNTDQVVKTKQFVANPPADILLAAMVNTIQDLNRRFGSWQQPWGEINRYQRLTGNTTEKYDDETVSIPSGYTASTWGCLASFVSRTFNTHKRYGFSGNSFIAAIEFGRKVKAKSLLAGGESGNPASPHFSDQAERYTRGQFKDVWFYKEDVMKHAEKTYHPGE